MKKSYYNFIFDKENGKSILYNSRTGGMAELDKEHTTQLKYMSEAELEEKNPEFAAALLQNGFAVADEISELDMIRYDMLRTRFGNQALNVTVAVTQDCNFGCKYCYEKDVLHKKYMDDEVQNAIVEYVRERLVAEENLYVCWYGGEPLLNVECISNLTECFLQICKEKNVKYHANIITNGYLLTPEVTSILVACKITQIQITLDGDMETHNQRRPLIDGSGTYQTIWDNLIALKEYKKVIKVVLRVNVDRGNIHALNDVKEQIIRYNMEDFIFVYPGKVTGTDGCHNEGNCYSNKEFALLEQEFACQNLGFLHSRYPYPRQIACGAEDAGSVIFDAYGDMYKCFMDIGRKEFSIGNIKDNELCHEEVLHNYLLSDVTVRRQCSRCCYLPICMGGCVKERNNNGESCTTLKHTIKKYVEEWINMEKK